MLERYQIKQKISHKAGRSTYIAQDSETDEQVVIKILEFNDLFDWEDFKLFEREAQILQNLSHPNIPTYLDYFEISESDRQGFALVQTYIDAPSLAELIERGIKFTETEIIELAEKLLNILNYLHGLNPPVIHRDIKPSNILLTNRSGNSIGDVYLVDFGSGQTVAKKEAGSITIVGTYGYIPLEQFMGQTTFASDLYSLGMTLIYLVTGIHPAELTQVKGKVQFNNKEMNRNFLLWLEKITDSYVENRYQSANIALTALHSEDNVGGNFTHLKPKDSQINLYRDKDKLIIIYYDSTTYVNAGFAITSLIILILISLATLSSIALLFAIIIFAMLTIIIGRQLSDEEIKLNYRLVEYVFVEIANNNFRIGKLSQKLSLSNYKESDSLSIANHDIQLDSIYNKSTEVEWNYLFSNEKINNIIYSSSYSFDKCIDSKGNLIKGQKITVPGKLSIVGSSQKHTIKNDKFFDAEYWWVGHEISDFLDLELQVISPTPVVPSKSEDTECSFYMIFKTIFAME